MFSNTVFLMKRLLLNNIPLWRGQRKLGVKYGSSLLNTITHERIQGRIPIQANFFRSSILNKFELTDNIHLFKKYVCPVIEEQYKKGDLVLNLGGDHAISIATIPPMLNKYPNLRVVWVDAHADINSPEESGSGNVHGMPVHFVSTLDSDKKDNKLLLKNLVYVGVRDTDFPERKLMEKYDIRNYTKKEIDKRGIHLVVNEMMIEKELLVNPIHLSLDIDGLDPEFCPSTGTTSDKGLSINDVINLCRRLKQTGNLVSIDLVEFNPFIGSQYEVENTLHNIKQILDVLIE